MEGNRRVDLHGALGELLLYGMARECANSKAALLYMQSHLFRKTGGKDVKGPDLLFDDNGERIGIDVKTFDCSPNKRYFAVNDNKHLELAGQCFGYMGLVCPSFATHACISTLIPYEKVSEWERQTLRANGLPSRNEPIAAFMSEHGVPSYSIGESRRSVHDKNEVRSLALQTGHSSVAGGLLKLLPEIEAELHEAQQRIRHE